MDKQYDVRVKEKVEGFLKSKYMRKPDICNEMNATCKK